MMAPMAQKFLILRGLQALYAMPSYHLDTRSRIQLCNPIARSSYASCLNKRILTSSNAFRIFGGFGFGSGPLGNSTFRFASGGGAGGRFGGSGGGRSSSGGVPRTTGPFFRDSIHCCYAPHLMVDRVAAVNLKQALTFTLLGMVLVSPTLHFWYLYLSKLITASGNFGALLQLLLDQLCFVPIFIGTFLLVLMALEGRPSGVISKLQQHWFSSVVANWQLWIPFRYVPQLFQVLASNVVALIWNAILSYKAHKEILVK